MLIIWFAVFAIKIHSQEIPRLDTLTLNTGLKIYLLQYGEDSVLYVKLVINGGKKDETACQVGYSEIIQQLLTESLKEKQKTWFKRANRVSYKTNGGQTIVNGKCARMDLSKEMELLSTAVSMLSFKRGQIDRIVSSISERYKPENISAGSLSAVYRNLLLYGRESPLGRSYCQYQVQKALPEQLREFYAAHYTPGRASLLICGNFNVNEVKKMIVKHFVKWRPLRKEEKFTEESEPGILKIKNKTIAFINKRDAKQCLLKWALVAPSAKSPDHLAFLVACDLLDRYLTEKRREMEGVDRDTLMFKPIAYANGFMEVNCTAGHHGMTRAIHLMDTTLQSFGQLTITETSLAETVNKLKEEYIQNETPASILSFYDPLAYQFEWRKNYPDLLSGIKMPDIQTIVKKYFSPAAYKLIIVGQEQIASGQLGALSNVTNYETSDFETCDEACKEIVIVKCHCESCYRRGQCYTWRFDPSRKEAIKNARSRAKASLK